MNVRINLSAQLILVFLVIVTFDNVSCFSDSNPRANNSARSYNVGQPLLLTPFLSTGQDSLARYRAKVLHPAFSNFESYAGYFNVNNKTNSNLFFWYFPAKENAETAPVVLFLEGTLGKSVFFSVSAQNGPFSMTPRGSLYPRRYSWNNMHNVIYIDSLIGSGYSSANSDANYAKTESENVANLYEAVIQFFQLFPMLRKNNFFITGNFYAGKFVPQLARMIENSKDLENTDKKINLKGIVIANGWTDPINQFAFGKYLYSVGLIDAREKEKFLELEGKMSTLIMQNRHSEAHDILGQLLMNENSLFNNLTAYDRPFNVLQNRKLLIPDAFTKFIQRVDLRRALHVGNNRFEGFNRKGLNYLKNDMTRSEAQSIALLLEKYRVLIFTGNLDILCSPPSVKKFLQKLKWSGSSEYGTVNFQELRDSRRRLAGYVKKARNLTEIVVRNAGHFSLLEQPLWTSEILEKFSHGLL